MDPVRYSWLGRSGAFICLSSCLALGVFGETNRCLAEPGDTIVQIYSSQHSWDSKSAFGHAFLCVERHLTSTIKEECFGFYPKQGAQILIGGTGLAANEAIEKKPLRFRPGEITSQISKNVNSGELSAIFALMDEWNTKQYKLTNSNCIDFVHAVARLLNFHLPARSLAQTPTQYMKELKRLNGK